MTDKQLYNNIFKYWESDHLSIALEMSHEYLKLVPNSISVAILQVDILISFNRFVEANKILERLSNIQKKDQIFQVYLQYGHLYKRSSNLKKSSSWYKRALLIDHDNAIVRIYIANNYMALGMFEKAKKYLNQLIELDTELLDEAFFNLGFIEKSLGNYSGAVLFFDKAIEIDPDYKIAIKQKKDVLLALKYMTTPDDF